MLDGWMGVCGKVGWGVVLRVGVLGGSVGRVWGFVWGRWKGLSIWGYSQFLICNEARLCEVQDHYKTPCCMYV